jgi:hypothetical protein
VHDSKIGRSTSEEGHSRCFRDVGCESALPPKNRHRQLDQPRPKSASNGSDSITSSAGNSNVGIVEQQRLARDVERALDSPPRIIPRMSEADRRPGTFRSWVPLGPIGPSIRAAAAEAGRAQAYRKIENIHG